MACFEFPSHQGRGTFMIDESILLISIDKFKKIPGI